VELDKSFTTPEFERFLLPLKAVLVQPLDVDGVPLAEPGKGPRTATGFIRVERSHPFLYVCWHTVTGLDRNTRALPAKPLFPRKLRIRLQEVDKKPGHIEVVGGKRELTIDLYSSERRPLWLQDRQHVVNNDLAAVGLRFPFWHDAVKVPLPSIDLAMGQALNDAGGTFAGTILPGDRVLFVGYPCGYSALENPTPVVLTAHIAATMFKENRHEVLLDRAGAPGMSGGPVFLERESRLHAVGIYTGAIHPGQRGLNATSLGSFSDLLLCWGHESMAFIRADSEAAEPIEPAALDGLTWSDST
jgi:hypothetical protein